MPAPNDMNDDFVDTLLGAAVRLQRAGVTNQAILNAMQAAAPRRLAECLLDEHVELMNAFNGNPWHDGLVRDRLAEIERSLDGLKVPHTKAAPPKPGQQTPDYQSGFERILRERLVAQGAVSTTDQLHFALRAAGLMLALK